MSVLAVAGVAYVVVGLCLMVIDLKLTWNPRESLWELLVESFLIGALWPLSLWVGFVEGRRRGDW